MSYGGVFRVFPHQAVQHVVAVAIIAAQPAAVAPNAAVIAASHRDTTAVRETTREQGPVRRYSTAVAAVLAGPYTPSAVAAIVPIVAYRRDFAAVRETTREVFSPATIERVALLYHDGTAVARPPAHFRRLQLAPRYVPEAEPQRRYPTAVAIIAAQRTVSRTTVPIFARVVIDTPGLWEAFAEQWPVDLLPRNAAWPEAVLSPAAEIATLGRRDLAAVWDAFTDARVIEYPNRLPLFVLRSASVTITVDTQTRTISISDGRTITIDPQ